MPLLLESSIVASRLQLGHYVIFGPFHCLCHWLSPLRWRRSNDVYVANIVFSANSKQLAPTCTNNNNSKHDDAIYYSHSYRYSLTDICYFATAAAAVVVSRLRNVTQTHSVAMIWLVVEHTQPTSSLSLSVCLLAHAPPNRPQFWLVFCYLLAL